ncbi:unnamed protein product, partial [Polarella glacialis]
MATTPCRVLTETRHTFFLTVPYQSNDQYKPGQAVRSPWRSIEDCEVRLSVFPGGRIFFWSFGQFQTVSAFVQLQPKDASGDWELPDVEFRISVFRSEPGIWKKGEHFEGVIGKIKHTFSNHLIARDWQLPETDTTNVRQLQELGYLKLPEMELLFQFEVAGCFVPRRLTKRAKLDYGTESWRDMKFTDMVLCAEDEGGPELPCHRHVLAKFSE